MQSYIAVAETKIIGLYFKMFFFLWLHDALSDAPTELGNLNESIKTNKTTKLFHNQTNKKYRSLLLEDLFRYPKAISRIKIDLNTKFVRKIVFSEMSILMRNYIEREREKSKSNVLIPQMIGFKSVVCRH